MSDKIKLAAAGGADAGASPQKAGDPDEGPSKKFTMVMPGAMDFRLYGLASSLGITKADLVFKLVTQGLERYGLDAELKAVYAKITAQASKVA
jgi:hypothetical protein